MTKPFAVAPPVTFELAPSPEPLLPFELPAAEFPAVAVSSAREEEEATTASRPKTAPQVVPPHAPPGAEAAPLSVAGVHEAAAAAEARPSCILGRIDLRKTIPTPQSQRRPEAPRAPVASRAKESEKVSGAEVIKKQPHKRTVIRTPGVSELGEREVRLLRALKKKKPLPSREQKPTTELTVPKANKRVSKVAEVITVGELAKAMGVKVADVITKLMRLGMLATVNQVGRGYGNTGCG